MIMKNSPINVIAFSGFYLPGYKGGGPIKTIKNLFDETGKEINFKLITSDHDLGDKSPYNNICSNEWNKVGNADVFYTQSGIKGYKQIAQILSRKDYDLIYLNSFFSLQFSFFPLLIAKFLRQKIILGPRGEFSAGALNLKSFKKSLFIRFYKIFCLHYSVVFQASSEFEFLDIKKVLGAKVDIYIAEDIGAQYFTENFPVSNGSRLNIVFLARISPMKNLLLALEILKQVKHLVTYDIYGPIEDQQYWEQCKEIILDLPSNIKVEYKGQLQPSNVIEVLSKYDLFFMPTQGENYGHVIAEALCAGVPILIADTTPWRNLEEQGIGWDLSLNNPKAFSNVIDTMVMLSEEQRLQMRKNVLEWAKNKFSNREAIEANIDMFNYTISKNR